MDAASGRVRGVWHVDVEYAQNIEPLGDGTWLYLRNNQHRNGMRSVPTRTGKAGAVDVRIEGGHSMGVTGCDDRW